jgi:hypothetical protein
MSTPAPSLAHNGLADEDVKLRALDEGYRCRVCQGPNVRALRRQTGYFRTCSPRCSRLWTKARYHLDDDYRLRHFSTIARWILKNEHRVSSTQLRSAVRTVTGERSSRGRWTVSGSKSDQAVAEILILRAQTAWRGEALLSIVDEVLSGLPVNLTRVS